MHKAIKIEINQYRVNVYWKQWFSKYTYVRKGVLNRFSLIGDISPIRFGLINDIIDENKQYKYQFTVKST